MTVLVYADSVKGHYPEYVHHMYMAAVIRPDVRFVFVVPERFKEVMGGMEWTEAENTEFEYIPQADVDYIDNSGMLKASIKRCRIVNKAARKYNADKVFAMTLMYMLPMAPFMLRRKLKLSGIIYKIYLYEQDESSRLRRLSDRLKYFLITGMGRVDKAFVLNDSDAAKRLNAIHGTDVFDFLPDPVNEIVPTKERNAMRAEIGVGADDRLFIHIGAMARRKGTLLVLDSIEALSDEQRQRYVFYFAGRVGADIKDAFNDRVKSLREIGARIHVSEGFCSYEFLANLCVAADGIVIPYLETAQSSGIIGYASLFGAPAVATGKGMIGNLVKQYGLGIGVEPEPGEIAKAYSLIDSEQIRAGDGYLHSHKISDFQNKFITFVK